MQNPSLRPPLSNALTHIRAGNLAEANRILVAEVRAHPDDAMAWYLLSFALTDVAKQVKALERTLEIDPGMTRARERLTVLAPMPLLDPVANDAATVHAADPPVPQRRTKPARSRRPVIAGILALAAIVVLALVILYALRPAPTSGTANPPAQNSAATFPAEADAALRDYILDHQADGDFQIVSAVQATVPQELAALHSIRSYEEAWCVVVSPAQVLQFDHRADAHSTFAVARTGLLWEIPTLFMYGVQAHEEKWLRAGCGNWQVAAQVQANAVADPTQNALLAVLPGEYSSYNNTTLTLRGGAAGGTAIIHALLNDQTGTYTVIGDRVVLDGLDEYNGSYTLSYDPARSWLTLSGGSADSFGGRRETQASLDFEATATTSVRMTASVRSAATQTAAVPTRTAEATRRSGEATRESAATATYQAIQAPTQTQAASAEQSLLQTAQAVQAQVNNLNTFFLVLEDGTGDLSFTFSGERTAILFVGRRGEYLSFRPEVDEGYRLLSNSITLYDPEQRSMPLNYVDSIESEFIKIIPTDGIYTIVLEANSALAAGQTVSIQVRPHER